MNGLNYLAVAFGLIWAGVLLYLLRLSALRRNMERRLAGIEDRLERGGRTDG